MAFLVNIAIHFSLLYAGRREASHEKLGEIDPAVFVDAMVDSCTNENQSLCTSVQKLLDVVIQVSEAYCGGKAEISQLPIFSHLAEKACLSCNRYEWYYKAGGCFLISYLSARLDVQWVRAQEAEFIKSLFFITRELSPSISITTVDEATNTLLVLIRICHGFVYLVLRISSFQKCSQREPRAPRGGSFSASFSTYRAKSSCPKEYATSSRDSGRDIYDKSNRSALKQGVRKSRDQNSWSALT